MWKSKATSSTDADKASLKPLVSNVLPILSENAIHYSSTISYNFFDTNVSQSQAHIPSKQILYTSSNATSKNSVSSAKSSVQFICENTESLDNSTEAINSRAIYKNSTGNSSISAASTISSNNLSTSTNSPNVPISLFDISSYSDLSTAITIPSQSCIAASVTSTPSFSYFITSANRTAASYSNSVSESLISSSISTSINNKFNANCKSLHIVSASPSVVSFNTQYSAADPTACLSLSFSSGAESKYLHAAPPLYSTTHVTLTSSTTQSNVSFTPLQPSPKIKEPINFCSNTTADFVMSSGLTKESADKLLIHSLQQSAQVYSSHCQQPVSVQSLNVLCNKTECDSPSKLAALAEFDQLNGEIDSLQEELHKLAEHASFIQHQMVLLLSRWSTAVSPHSILDVICAGQSCAEKLQDSFTRINEQNMTWKAQKDQFDHKLMDLTGEYNDKMDSDE